VAGPGNITQFAEEHHHLPMSDIPPLHTLQLLKQYGLWAAKGLGQNFLEDPDALQQIADAAQIGPSDSVLEIGPGLGSLTRYLAVAAREVVAVELDAKFLPVLRKALKGYGNVRVVLADMLELSPAELGLQPGYLVAANIPYHITSALLRHLLSSDPKPARMVLTVQKEVAQRICAKPPDMSLLALSVQVYGKPSIVLQIPAGAFYPVPKVDSAVVRVELYEEPVLEPRLLPTFFELIKAGFSQRRKMLRNALPGGLHVSPEDAGALLQQAGIDPRRRAETLDLGEWERMAKAREAGSAG
jgi:16S rRNA (adenine1518-N6/adenine1519-N6)-dimethyltransferase